MIYSKEIKMDIYANIQGKSVLVVGNHLTDIAIQIAGSGKSVLRVGESTSIPSSLEKQLTDQQGQLEFIEPDVFSEGLGDRIFETIIVAPQFNSPQKGEAFIEQIFKHLAFKGRLLTLYSFGYDDDVSTQNITYLLDPLKAVHSRFSVENIIIQDQILLLCCDRRRSKAKAVTNITAADVEKIEEEFSRIETGLRLQTSSGADTSAAKVEAARIEAALSEQMMKNALLLLNHYDIEGGKKLKRGKTVGEQLLLRLQHVLMQLQDARRGIPQAPIEAKKTKAADNAISAAEKEELEAKLEALQEELQSERAALEQSRKLEILPTNRPFKIRPLRNSAGCRLRVAGIMDEFTTACYAPECDYLALDPECWQEQLNEFQPDLVFIESAWHGNDDKWHLKVSTLSPELDGVLAWAKVTDTPSIFWNKEDPVHFVVFLDVAAKCNVVFTTDIDCIPSYKKHLGHNQVYLLPFAAQPNAHNPIKKYDRKDAFNFAGSYYLRYPERQRDIATLLETLKEIKPVEIYDRNHGKTHPHYIFPDEYQSMILGSLPFSEIDKAYKGYRYGININSIKQSQTMFARRVFEMMASNTVVISNFSRGVRMMFGDLAICTDDGQQIKNKLAPIVSDTTYYRKFRLLGLRKIMSEHTYRSRLKYILGKVVQHDALDDQPSVAVMAVLENAAQLKTIQENWARQNFEKKQLFLLVPRRTNTLNLSENISAFTTQQALVDAVMAQSETIDFFGGMVANDYYGPSYLTDLLLAEQYSDADGFGKVAHYTAKDKGFRTKRTIIELTQADACYTAADSLFLRCSILRASRLDPSLLNAFMNNPQKMNVRDMSFLALDEFNYCRTATAEQAAEIVDDLVIPWQGLKVETLLSTAETLPPGLPRKNLAGSSEESLDVDRLASYLRVSKSAPVTATKTSNQYILTSKLAEKTTNYVWMNRKFERSDINLVNQSQLSFEMEKTTKEAHFVCDFYRADDTKISHSMLPAGGNHSLAIPTDCTKLRFGIRVVGSGVIKLSKVVFGSDRAFPPTVIGRTDTLVLTKQYPSYDDLYKYGFLHSRVRGYRKKGLDVDIFRINTNIDKPYDEFENVNVASGDAKLLDTMLSSGQYRHVLVHLLDRNMWRVLSKYLDKIKVTIWIHGAEIQAWQRRSYEFSRMDKDQISFQKKLSAGRMKLWNEVFSNTSDNLHHVFVSRHFMGEIIEDVGLGPKEGQYSIVHNHIDGDIFRYVEKDIEQRKKILSIRPYSSMKYANDLSVNAIIELSKRRVFKALHFYIAGDGELFNSLTEPLQAFKNVTLHRGFLSHTEIAALHKRYGVFLTPTRMDSQGVSRDEAMASGLVPVTTKVAAIPEFVDRGSGVLTPPEDPIALADAIEELYKKPKHFLRLSKGAAERVRQQSGFSQTIAREIELIRR